MSSPLSQAAFEDPKADYTTRNRVKPSAGKRMMKYVDAAVCFSAGVAFDTIQYFNRFNPAPTFTPKWTEKPMLQSWQKTKPGGPGGHHQWRRRMAEVAP